MRAAHVYDLEQPRFPACRFTHAPAGLFHALHRRHRDNYRPSGGPRRGASGVLTMMEHSGTHIDALCIRPAT